MAKKSFINRAIMKAIRQHKNFFLGDQQAVYVCRRWVLKLMNIKRYKGLLSAVVV